MNFAYNINLLQMAKNYIESDWGKNSATFSSIV